MAANQEMSKETTNVETHESSKDMPKKEKSSMSKEEKISQAKKRIKGVILQPYRKLFQ